jgi:hypothetical protein
VIRKGSSLTKFFGCLDFALLSNIYSPPCFGNGFCALSVGMFNLISLKAFENKLMLKSSCFSAFGRSSISLILHVSRVSLLFFSFVFSLDGSDSFRFFIFELISLALGSIGYNLLLSFFSSSLYNKYNFTLLFRIVPSEY